jgi:hypothetical protein
MSDEDDKRFRKLTDGTALGKDTGASSIRRALLRHLESTAVRLISEYNDNYGSIELRVTKPIPASGALPGSSRSGVSG